jgi:glutathione S-transferase
MSELILHVGNKNYSSWSLRPWLAMRQSGIPFREELHQIEGDGPRRRIRELSPGGRVPFLQSGDFVTWDSLAIVEHVAELHPEAGLWPKDARARALARSACAEMHSGFQALRTAMTMNVRKRYPRGPRTPDVQADVDRIVALWSQLRGAHGRGGPFLFGTFTAADAFYAPVVTRFRTYDVPLDAPSQAYCESILALPAMQEWCAAAEAEPWTIAKYEYSV